MNQKNTRILYHYKNKITFLESFLYFFWGSKFEKKKFSLIVLDVEQFPWQLCQ